MGPDDDTFFYPSSSLLIYAIIPYSMFTACKMHFIYSLLLTILILIQKINTLSHAIISPFFKPIKKMYILSNPNLLIFCLFQAKSTINIYLAINIIVFVYLTNLLRKQLTQTHFCKKKRIIIMQNHFFIISPLSWSE